jgi:hypothetical protein
VKGLAALCRMVLKPKDYSGVYLDADRLILNERVDKKKKKRAEQMQDIEFAVKLAKLLCKNLSLNTEVCHSLLGYIESSDFIFSEGAGWLDPGSKITLPELPVFFPIK